MNLEYSNRLRVMISIARSWKRNTGSVTALYLFPKRGGLSTMRELMREIPSPYQRTLLNLP